MGLGDRIRNGWNAFMNRDPTEDFSKKLINGMVYNTRPDRTRLLPGNERTIINAIENRIAIDVSSVKIVHARLDENGRFQNTINSGLQNCMVLSANKDQTGRAFFQDLTQVYLKQLQLISSNSSLTQATQDLTQATQYLTQVHLKILLKPLLLQPSWLLRLQERLSFSSRLPWLP